jgi:hypothetical protein
MSLNGNYLAAEKSFDVKETSPAAFSRSLRAFGPGAASKWESMLSSKAYLPGIEKGDDLEVCLERGSGIRQQKLSAVYDGGRLLLESAVYYDSV